MFDFITSYANEHTHWKGQKSDGPGIPGVSTRTILIGIGLHTHQ